MKQLRNFFMVMVFVLVPFSTFAQTMKEVTEAYNAAVQLLTTDKEAAIVQFEKCLELCNVVGTEADGTKQDVINGLPGIYFDKAMEEYKAKKLDLALVSFQKAEEVALKYNDEKTQKKAQSVIPQLYFGIGNNFYKADNFDQALVNFKKATELDPAYTKAWFAMGLVYRKKDDITNMQVAMDKAIETGMAGNDQKTVDQAEKATRDYLMVLAGKANNKQDYDEAIRLAQKSLVYDKSYLEAYYLLAVVYNKGNKWQDAVQAASKALELLAPGTDGAKIQFELGLGYMGLSDNEKACSAFKVAMANKTYEQNAKYYIEQKLKCQ